MAEEQKECLILGIDKEIIEKFLILVRDKFHLVDKANYFLESNTNISGSNIAMANQRDFVSHLCTILANPDFSKSEQYDQVSAAEEHLRRAIIESYQLTVSVTQEKIEELIEIYKKTVIPNGNKHSLLNSDLDLETIRKKIDEIKQLKTDGRKAKARNAWDDEWEKGVKTLLKAFLKAKDLEALLEDHIMRGQQIASINKTQVVLAWWSILATILSIVLGVYTFM